MTRLTASAVAASLLLVAACSGSSSETSGPALAAVLAQDKAAQSVLRNGLAAAKVYFTEGNTFSGFDAAAGARIEPSFPWLGDEAATVGAVSIDLAQDVDLVLSTLSESGTAFCLSEDADGYTYGRADAAGASSVADCPGSDDGWSSGAGAG